MSIVARREQGAFDPAAQLADLIGTAGEDGTVVSFVGLARPIGRGGAGIDRLVLEHHPKLTVRSLDAIAAASAEKLAVSPVRVVHRCGAVPPGEPIVFAGASAAHRRAAFEAADYVMDKLKTEAVFWKCEEGSSGTNWIEPTDADHADAARWSR